MSGAMEVQMHVEFRDDYDMTFVSNEKVLFASNKS